MGILPRSTRLRSTVVTEEYPCETAVMACDPYVPYGPVADGSCRVATWNVWGRYGDWSARLEGIRSELRQREPDVVCLAEAWETADESQTDKVSPIGGVG